MEWTHILTAIFTSGLTSQLIISFITLRKSLKLESLVREREKDNWWREQWFKTSVSFMETISDHNSRTEFQGWSDEIRAASLRIKLLCPNGEPAAALAESMKNSFQLHIPARRELKKVAGRTIFGLMPKY